MAFAKSGGQRSVPRRGRPELGCGFDCCEWAVLAWQRGAPACLRWSGAAGWTRISKICVLEPHCLWNKQNLIIRSSHHKGTRIKGATREFIKRGRRCKEGKKRTRAQVRGVAEAQPRVKLHWWRHEWLFSLRAVRLHACLLSYYINTMSPTFYITLGWLCCSEWTNVIPQSNGPTGLFRIGFIWNASEGPFGYIWQLSGCTATRCCSSQWIRDTMFKWCTTQHVLQCTFSVEGYLPLFKYIGKESKKTMTLIISIFVTFLSTGVQILEIMTLFFFLSC